MLRQGGAISYAAAAASAYGVRACVVTAAAPGSDLSVFEGHELHVVPAAATLTFEHTYTWWGARPARRRRGEKEVGPVLALCLQPRASGSATVKRGRTAPCTCPCVATRALGALEGHAIR